jgi:hypothetical protein
VRLGHRRVGQFNCSGDSALAWPVETERWEILMKKFLVVSLGVSAAVVIAAAVANWPDIKRSMRMHEM